MKCDSFSEVSHVESNDGRKIPCSYIHHPRFSHDCHLSESLHYIFIIYSSERAYTQGYLLRKAITLFLDFVVSHDEKNSPSLRIVSISNINSEIFNSYKNYLLKNGEPISHAQAFKNALTGISQRIDSMPILQLPKLPQPDRKKKEPLTDEAYKTLSENLKEHIDTLYEKLEFRKLVNASEIYNRNSILASAFPETNRDNIFRWFNFKLHHKKKVLTSSISSKLISSNDKELIDIGKSDNCRNKFKSLYEREFDLNTNNDPIDPFDNKGIRNWVPSYERTIKTLLNEGYPFDITLDKIGNNLGHDKIININDCDNIIKLIMHRHLRCKTKTKVILCDWDDLLGMYFPTLVDMSSIVIFIMLQSGWNKETVLALDQDDFEHILTGAINETQALIYSEKHRSQGKGKPYFSPKEYIAPTDKTNKYSIYNLIILAKELSKPLQTYEFDYIPEHEDLDSLNPLFLCIRYYADWVNKGGRHTSISYPKAFLTGVRHFLSKYPIKEKGKLLKSAGDFTSRLRPTWVKHHRKNNPLSFTALAQGHEDKDTTDTYYDSSGPAMQERRERLRSELEEVVDLLRKREFSGLLVKHTIKDTRNNSLRIFTIPGQEKSLWACADQTKPDWIGCEKVIINGHKCYSIQNCLFCSQVRIFEDSLPYLIERLEHIIQHFDTYSDSEFKSSLKNEKNIIEYILDEWGNDEALKVASRYQRRNTPLIPSDLSSLNLIFEESNI